MVRRKDEGTGTRDVLDPAHFERGDVSRVGAEEVTLVEVAHEAR